jgi:GxxExxY protein
MRINEITEKVIKSAIEVHKELGLGLLESVYTRCMEIELNSSGLTVQIERPVSIKYKGHMIQEDGSRTDMTVENEVLLEFKSVEKLKEVHKKQLLIYLKLTGKQVGLLMNFNEALLKKGIIGIVNNFQQ